jgi:myo-inositol-1(or 4)-monophosphatase
LPAADVPPEIGALRGPLVEAVRAAGTLALASRATPLRTWHKANKSPVSEADIEVDRLLKARLMAETPDYGWLSEESVDDRARTQRRRVWIVDPIDGTRAYLAGSADWVVSAALVEDGRPILGAIFAPVEQAMFVAVRGAGATRNGAPVQVSGGSDMKSARIAGPRGPLSSLATLLPEIVSVPKIHSLALRLARVAEGTLEAAFVSHSGHDWDLAAADLLVHEAGGALTTLGGEPPIYNRADPVHGPLFAAGRARHAALAAIVREHRAWFA